MNELLRDGYDRDNTEFVLSLSYGKDSLASIHVIKDVLGWPLDRIITADIWATDTISANLPPVVAFKEYADKWILERYGIRVEHFCATDKNGEKRTYEKCFYKKRKGNKTFRQNIGKIYGFPIIKGSWCVNLLKTAAIKNAKEQKTKSKRTIEYLGIARDETERAKRHIKRDNILLPLVEANWDEDLCGLWCEYEKVISPTYITSARDGCWFCHKQSNDQLRLLRRNHADLWQMLLSFDLDSPFYFKPGNITVHDLDRRFEMEDLGLVPADRKFRWSMLDNPPGRQISLFDDITVKDGEQA